MDHRCQSYTVETFYIVIFLVSDGVLKAKKTSILPLLEEVRRGDKDLKFFGLITPTLTLPHQGGGD